MQPRLPFRATPDETAVPAVYFVRHRLARRYLLRVEPSGRVRVTIPRGGSRREAAAFAERQREWIGQQLVRLEGRASAIAREDRERLRALAEAELPGELHALAARFGLTVTRVSIRNQQARWGSCGRDGHITLNWRLVAMPAWIREYVLIHELMHLRRLDHSPKYWALVARVYPDYPRARAWLRTHGPTFQ